MERILVYGGTFDPPHNGHMALLACACKAVQPGRVLVVPAGVPPHKRASATPAAHRLAMARCFEGVWPGVQVDDIEVRRPGKSYTIDTLRQFHGRWPGAQLYLAIGSDMLTTFRIWHCWQEILRLAVLVVHSRENGDEPALRRFADGIAAEGGRVVFAPGQVLGISSTQVRQLARQGKPLGGLVPPLVERYIATHGLYAPGEEQERGNQA